MGTEKYETGIQAFEQEIKKKPNVANNYFYLGRFLLAQKKYIKANTQFKKAVVLDPGNDTYHFWLGVSYGGLKKDQLEIENYRKAIELNGRYAQAHTYLGHSRLRSKKYSLALKSYDKALSLRSDNPPALYNRALILNRLKRNSEAKSAFKQYLKDYGNSPKAITATAYLNQMGDFEYRIHLFNRRKIVLKKIDFDQFKPELKKESLPSLKIVGYMIKKNSRFVLHILSYQKNNKVLAQKKAKAVKIYLLNHYSGIQPEQIKLSWFDIPERISIGKRNHTLDDSINLFGVLKSGAE
ncbi:MAG: tetratricopeptide repeat protein [Desulfobacula sp.]|nr:tetratricopeptide repeat protein [Desulfobacula sp.]